MLRHFRDEFPEVMTEIAEKGELSKELEERIGKIIDDFKSHYDKEKEL